MYTGIDTRKHGGVNPHIFAVKKFKIEYETAQQLPMSRLNSISHMC